MRNWRSAARSRLGANASGTNSGFVLMPGETHLASVLIVSTADTEFAEQLCGEWTKTRGPPARKLSGVHEVLDQ